MNPRNYFDPIVLSKLQTLKLRAQHVVEGYVAGSHRSPSHGFSIEFAEHREYSPGDDLRYVDWKVFGRTDKFYLKQFEDETNLICMLVLDVSESMLYRGPESPWSKLDCAATAAASLAWLTLQQQDAVGLTTFDEQLRDFVQPSSNSSHLQHLLHILDSPSGARKTSTGRVLHELADRLGRRGIVVIFSDLFDDLEELVMGIKHLRHRRHDVVVMHTLDAAEVDFPFSHPTLFRGMEEMPDLNTDPRALRGAYLKHFGDFLRRIRTDCENLQVDYAQLRNDQPLDVALSTFLAQRMARIS